jgi:DNA-directed RNA polymerase specialized sigma subunit
VSNQYNDLLVSQMAQPLDAEKNLVLFQRVVAGDAAAREEMIVGNMPLAVAKVESFIRCSTAITHLRDDLAGAAFLGLVKAVNKMAAGKGPRKADPSAPLDFIGMWINRELGRLVEDETPIHVPHESDRLAKQNGDPIAPPVVCNVVPDRCEAPSYEQGLEIRDLIDPCCTTEEERTFVDMLQAGHSLAKIASAIKRSPPTVSRIRKKLKTRIQRKLKAMGDE